MGEQPGPPENREQWTRLEVNLNDEAAETMRSLMEVQGINATEVTRRMIALYDFFVECKVKGDKILVKDKNGKTTEINLF